MFPRRPVIPHSDHGCILTLTGSTCIQAETLYGAHNPLPRFKATKVYSRFVLCSNSLLNSMPTYQPSTSSTTRHHPRWMMRWYSFTATKLERTPQGTRLQTLEDEFDSVEDTYTRAHFCELVCSAIFRERTLQVLLRPEVVHNDEGICNIQVALHLRRASNARVVRQKRSSTSVWPRALRAKQDRACQDFAIRVSPST